MMHKVKIEKVEENRRNKSLKNEKGRELQMLLLGLH
jgi:hypothetical protein